MTLFFLALQCLCAIGACIELLAAASLCLAVILVVMIERGRGVKA